jgi:bis(5'-nucleosyl)-tetraphosphatase (symmetrical)
MAHYLIGDLQGCNDAFQRLLLAIDFSPSRDTVYLLGDLVNRGPDSAGVLRRLMGLGDSARCLLGNHDLHLLATAIGVRAQGKRDTLNGVLLAKDRPAMLHWLRHQHLALFEHGILMVHAGVLPSWSVRDTLRYAQEVETVLQSAACDDFLHSMYGNHPTAWHDDLQGHDRFRAILNALTRMRFCRADGVMDLTTSVGPAPTGFSPWFDVTGRHTEHTPIAFGHWSSLGWLEGRTQLLSLDSGCVWGGMLTALRLGSTPLLHERIQIKCPQAQDTGAD